MGDAEQKPRKRTKLDDLLAPKRKDSDAPSSEPEGNPDSESNPDPEAPQGASSSSTRMLSLSNSRAFCAESGKRVDKSDTQSAQAENLRRWWLAYRAMTDRIQRAASPPASVSPAHARAT